MNPQLERTLGRLILELPAPVKRRIAGAPLQRDGQRLELDTQVLLKLAEREPRPPLKGLTPAQARADLRHSVAQVLGREIALPDVREETVAGGAGESEGAPLHAAGRPRR